MEPEYWEQADWILEKDFSDEKRKKLASEGKAMKDGSYPIEDKADLENAIQAFGRSKNKAATKRHIIKRARALGATDMLPDDWVKEAVTTGSLATGDEYDSLMPNLKSVGADNEGRGVPLTDKSNTGRLSGGNVPSTEDSSNHPADNESRGAPEGHGRLKGDAPSAPGVADYHDKDFPKNREHVLNGDGGETIPEALGLQKPSEGKTPAKVGRSTEALSDASWEELSRRVSVAAQNHFGKISDPDGDGEDEVQLHSDYEGGSNAKSTYVSVEGTYPKHVIVKYPEGCMYKVPWEMDGASGNIKFGKPNEVVHKFVPLRESVGRDHILSASNSDTDGVKESSGTGRKWRVLMIERGVSKNGVNYSSEVLREAVPLFEGVPSFADHATDYDMVSRPERSIKDKIGTFNNVAYETGINLPDGRITEGVVGDYKVVSPWMRELLLESEAADAPDFVGFSIDSIIKMSQPRNFESSASGVGGGPRVVRDALKFLRANSVDAVTRPGAGGRIMRRLESAGAHNGGEVVDPEEIKAIAAKAAAEAVAASLKDTIGAAVKESLGLQKVGTDGGVQVNNLNLVELQNQVVEMREAQRMRACESMIDMALAAATGLSEVSKTRVRASLIDLSKRRMPEASDIETNIKEAVAYESAVVRMYNKPLSAGTRPALAMGMDMHDKFDLALRGMFEGSPQKDEKGEAVTPFRSIKEAYCRWTGKDYWDLNPLEIMRDFETRYDSAIDHQKVRESVSLSTWGSIYADNLYIVLIKSYRNAPYEKWKEMVSDIENVPDFQQRHWIRIGGYDDLGTVAEQQTYPPLTSPVDEKVNYSISKRGGIDDVTFEAIVDDRVGAIRRIPASMGRSAARTLYKFVLDLMTQGNPTMDYDSVALYNAGHNNLGNNIMTVSGVAAGVLAMRSQTVANESKEILGERNKPAYVIVPATLEYRARRIFMPSDAYAYGLNTSGNTDADTSYDPQAFKGAVRDVLVYDQLTSQTAWYMTANPDEVPTMVVGFLNGQQEPELYVQDQPTVGSAFTADKISYKVRHIYGGDILDHRSFYQGHA